jgi:O-antigen/teichoic acid export membrane protein
LLLRGPTSTTLLTNLLILGGATAAGVLSARALGPHGRGQLAVVVLWSGVVGLAGSLGLPSSCSYFVACWPGRRTALARWFIRIAARQAVAMTAASVVLFWWLHLRLGLGVPLAVEYMTWPAAGTFALYGAVYAQGSRDFSGFNKIRMISGTMPTVLMAIGTLILRLTPAEAGAAYLAPAWGGAVLAGIWFHRASRGPVGEPLSQRESRLLWSYGWRSVASLSGLALNNSADQYALGLIVPAASLGLYSVGASAASPLPALVGSFGMVGLPTVTRLTGAAKAAASWRILRRAACLLLCVAPPFALLLPWFIPWIYGARYSAAVVPAEFLLVGTSFAALTTAVDALLQAYGLPGVVSVTQGAGGVLTIAGTLILGGRSLAAVALASSAGFILTFALALAKLRTATRHPRRGTAAIKMNGGGRTALSNAHRPAHARPANYPGSLGLLRHRRRSQHSSGAVEERGFIRP